MALRIPLAMNQTEGFMEEVPSGDTTDLRAGASVAGDINYSSGGEPRGLPATPTASDAAASKAYVDAVAAGLNPRPHVRVAGNEDFDAFTPGGGPGVGATLTSPTTAVTENDVDGVTVAVGDRVLVKDYGATSANVENGIYEVTQLADGASASMIMTRATDFDESAEVNQGDSVFVAEGTVNAKRTYALITPDPITIDVTAQEWAVVSGPGFLTAGAGLLDTTNTWSVELHTVAAATGGGTGGGSSGLEFDVTGDSGKLRAAVSATGALQRAADGLAVKLEATNPSLQVVANELGVKIDPAGALQKIAAGLGVKLEATNPSLEITGSNELSVKEDGNRGLATDGTGLYVKVNGTSITFNGSGQLQVGAAPASRVSADYAVGEAIAIGDAVNWSATNDRIEKSRADTDAKARVIGVAETAQGTVGQNSTIVSHGPCVGAITTATAGQAYYLQATGGIGTSLPGAGDRVVQVGIAKNASDLFVRVVDYGKKAA